MIIFVDPLPDGCRLADNQYTPGSIFVIGLKRRDPWDKEVLKRERRVKTR